MSEQNTPDSNDVIVYPRMDPEFMTKEDITDHLREAHGVYSISGNTVIKNMKMTKDALIEYHQRIHDALDRLAAGDPYMDEEVRYANQIGKHPHVIEYAQTKEEASGYRRSMRAAFPIPAVAHRHESIEEVASAEAKSQAAKARNNEPVSDKPLSVQERKVLKELVDNDFNALRSEMMQFAADALATTKREIEAEWEDKVSEAPSYGVRFTELVRKQQAEQARLRQRHEDERKALTDEAERAGVEISDSRQRRDDGSTIFQTEVKGLKDALKKAEQENKAMLDRALLSLERQRLTAQRQVLVSGVSKEAATILDTIPEAKTLMVDAEKKQNELTA